MKHPPRCLLLKIDGEFLSGSEQDGRWHFHSSINGLAEKHDGVTDRGPVCREFIALAAQKGDKEFREYLNKKARRL